MIEKKQGCMYCDEVCEHRDSLMIKICDFEHSKLYLFRDQKNRGRCILAYDGHATDLTDLSEKELNDFNKELMAVANAIHRGFNPDKINYGSYADTVKHLPIHVVPKYIDGPNWNGPFSDANPKYLKDDEYQEIIEIFKKELKK